MLPSLMQRRCKDKCRPHFADLAHTGPPGAFDSSCEGCSWIVFRWGEYGKKFPITEENLTTLKQFETQHRQNGPELKPGTKCKTCDMPLIR